jgi:multiple sugar transport system ATP-binding protein
VFVTITITLRAGADTVQPARTRYRVPDGPTLPDKAAGLLDLEKYLDRKPKALSGGQRQRVAMGRAIVREPSVFLMDEPLSNLDAKLRVETRANIAELQSRLGTTTVNVTHDQVEAMTMGHRVAVLKDGILNQVDSPRTLYDKPVNVFVAGFMGSPAMNLLTVPLVGDGAQLGDATFALPRSVLSEASTAGLKEVTFGVRPENITLADKGIPVTIDLVEELGADAFVHGHTPDGNRLVIRADARIHPSQGSTVYALPTDADHCHVFDPNTGIRFKSSDAVPADATKAAATASTVTLGK